MFFNIGPGEIFIILVIALLIFGPDRLPEMMRQLGRWVRAFRRWASDITAEFNAITQELSGELEELRQVTRELQEELRGVQADLASETRDISDALRTDGSLSSIFESSPGESVAYASSGAQSTSTGWSTTSYATEAVMGTSSDSWSAGNQSTNGSAPKMASKDDPTVDVAQFDLDETVVMPRSERRVNGHQRLNGHLPEAVVTVQEAPASVVPARPVRRGRPAAAAHQRQHRRTTVSA